jgi:aspartyl-tRNA synthetase, bacterial type
MYRTHTCGELNLTRKQETVTLSGWVQRIRRLGGMTFIDLRDRYGITQLVCNDSSPEQVKTIIEHVGREYVIQVKGLVIERTSKNLKLSTGEIEVQLGQITILSKSETPPFTVEDETDGGEEIRMKYRYIDLRRNPLQAAIALRHRMAQEIRRYLDEQAFLEIETPYLIKSTPEGARDFVVPSRMNQGQFYALPQSPQQFKQLLMVAGYDKYFQIVRCFRDEDLRADRQPEFTQIDCEMSFVEQEDVISTFEGMAKYLFKVVKNIEFTQQFPRLTFAEAMERFGSDKPDIRFGMEINDLGEQTRGKNFKVVDDAEFVGGICVPGCGEYSRKQLDELTLWVQRPQVGAKGLIYLKWQNDGTIKSSVDKFYSAPEMETWFQKVGGGKGDLLLILTGSKKKMLGALGDLRLEMANRLGLRPKDTFAPLWVVDFPLLEWDEESNRFYAMHHPFTSPKEEDIPLMETDPGKVRANAYDFVVNGVEIGGGSIRIHDSEVQKLMFKKLGFTDEEAKKQFGFIINAFRYGAPPHGGIAFGFDRFCAIFGGSDSIRDFIAFPKNNAGRDLMADSPSPISDLQLQELALKLNLKS